VQWSLKGITQELGVSWPLDLWYASSATAHQLMPHRLAREVDGVTHWGGPSPVEDRVYWLTCTTTIIVGSCRYGE
jgi:hypothetical protein